MLDSNLKRFITPRCLIHVIAIDVSTCWFLFLFKPNHPKMSLKMVRFEKEQMLLRNEGVWHM